MKAIHLLATLFPPTLAIPRPTNRQITDAGDLSTFVFPQWTITNFTAACTPITTCHFSFNLTSPTTPTEPAIDAFCDTLDGNLAEWQPCNMPHVAGDKSDPTVWALPEQGEETVLRRVALQHRFTNATLTPTREFNVTGHVTINVATGTGPVNFTVGGNSVQEKWWWLRLRPRGELDGTFCDARCEEVRDVDGSVRGYLYLETQQRAFQREQRKGLAIPERQGIIAGRDLAEIRRKA